MHGRFRVAALVVMTAATTWFHGVAKAQGGGRTVWDGVYSAAQAELGKHRYSGQCGSCHGRAMEGGHIFGSRTRTAPALRGEAFLSHWIGHSVGDLFNQISTSISTWTRRLLPINRSNRVRMTNRNTAILKTTKVLCLLEGISTK